MADLRAFQPAFSAGILSRSLWARVDLSKYQTGMKDAVNLFCHAHGGVSNRAGLQFVGEVKDSTKQARIIRFQFNTEQSYVLEFGHNTLRIYRDGGLILSGGSAYEIATPYTSGQVQSIVVIQEADVMYICHQSFAPRKLSRLADDSWTLTTVDFAPKIAAPATVSSVGRWKFWNGNTDGYSFKVTAVSATGAESAASAVTTELRWQWENFDGRFIRVSWNAVAGAALYRVYRITDGPGVVAETTDTSADMPVGPGGFVGDGTVPPTVSAGGAPSVPTGVSAAIVFGEDYEYCVSAISEDTGEESLPSASTTVKNDMSIKGNTNTITWTAVAGASKYYVYRKSNGSWGYIGSSDGTSFIDENITVDISQGPQDGFNPFSGPGKYPRCATFIEQRLAFGGTNNEPQGVWLSQSANYENFGSSSPARDSDAVTFRIKAKQVNEIRSMISTRGLLLLTSGAEWIVTGDGNGAPITPSAIKIDNQGYRGSSSIQPITVGSTVLFPQDRGAVVRDFSYEFTSDAYAGKDLTVLARDLFEGKSIVAWDYAQAPHSIVWVVMDDGSLISLTYMKEHEVWAWTRHESGASALFEDVVVVAEGKEDVPYFLVRRKIGGIWKRYIERLHTREMAGVEDAFFVDCGLTYEGAAATVISGLEHLEGMGVVALADGNVVRDLTVSGGSVTLPFAAQTVHIGLPMTATLETLDLDLGQVQGLGTVQGRMKSVAEVTLRVQDTRGIWIGPKDGARGDDRLVELKQRATEAWGAPIEMFTGDVRITPHWDWNTAGSVFVKQFDPLPMTILAIMPDVVVGK